MPAKKTSERKRYPSGEIVFAKLKGYPWWPAKIEDENNVPKPVLEAKKKKKTTTGAYIVFFFGSLDYAFFSEKMLRPFNHETVQQDIKAAKFKNKDLVEALYQALDPTSLDFLQESTQQQNHDEDEDDGTTTLSSDALYQQQEMKHSKPSITSASRSLAKRKGTAVATATTMTTAAATKKNTTKSIKKRSLESDDYNKTNSGNGQSTITGNNKKRRKSSPTDTPISIMAEPPKSQPLIHKSKYIELAARNSPEYERIFKHIYGQRHKLQKLIYDKKPGQVPTSDHSKISDILKDIGQCNMTKELLKDTKIGKVVRFGCNYVFKNDKSYRLQERCVGIMKNWKASLLDQHDTPTATTALSELPKDTTISNKSPPPPQPSSATFDKNSGCEENNKSDLIATPTSPEAGKIIPLATESHSKDNDKMASNTSILENNQPPIATQKRPNDDNNTNGTTKMELKISNDPLGDVLGNLDPSSTASPTTMTDNLIPLPQAFNMEKKDCHHQRCYFQVSSQD